MRERHLLTLKTLAPGIRSGEHGRPEQRARCNRRAVIRVEIREMNDVRQRGELPDDVADLGAPIEELSPVAVAIDAEHERRLELGVAIEYAARAEIGTAARPDGADTRSCEHGHDGFRRVRQ